MTDRLAADKDGGARSVGEGFAVASLIGRHVYLRPLMPEDYSFVRASELSGDLAVRWRFRGMTPSPEQWVQRVWQSVLAQLLIVRKRDHRPLGLVMAYNASHQDGYAFFGLEAFGPRRRAPLLIFGTALFIEYLFKCWNFHKLYVELPEYNADQFASGIGRLFTTEGRLQQHLWYGERRWDYLTLALYRDTWQRESTRMLAAEVPREDAIMRVRLPQEKDTPVGT